MSKATYVTYLSQGTAKDIPAPAPKSHASSNTKRLNAVSNPGPQDWIQ